MSLDSHERVHLIDFTQNDKCEIDFIKLSSDRKVIEMFVHQNSFYFLSEGQGN